MIKPPRIKPYECKHHRWEKWHHYGSAMYESGCKLSGDKFACKYYDAKECPNYKPKEEKQ